jgi:hypothetical protein
MRQAHILGKQFRPRTNVERPVNLADVAMHRVATDLEAVCYLLFRMSAQNEIEDTAFGCGKRQAIGCGWRRLEDIANTLSFRLWFTLAATYASRYDLKYDATQMQLLTGPNLLRRLNAFAVKKGAVVAAQVADRDVSAKN